MHSAVLMPWTQWCSRPLQQPQNPRMDGQAQQLPGMLLQKLLRKLPGPGPHGTSLQAAKPAWMPGTTRLVCNHLGCHSQTLPLSCLLPWLWLQLAPRMQGGRFHKMCIQQLSACFGLAALAVQCMQPSIRCRCALDTQTACSKDFPQTGHPASPHSADPSSQPPLLHRPPCPAQHSQGLSGGWALASGTILSSQSWTMMACMNLSWKLLAQWRTMGMLVLGTLLWVP